MTADQHDLATTVEAVIDRMRRIGQDLDPLDGVACFNRMYLQVTELVAANLVEGFFDDAPFVERLDVVFANLYFHNVDAAPRGHKPEACWAPLFEARDNRTIWPVQFALAGMNAHINHDLALAVVQTCKERGTTPSTPPVHSDFLKVNELLAKAESQVRQSFETHLVRLATKDAEALKHIVGSFSIARARDAAWATVTMLWPQRDTAFLFDGSTATLAQTVGTAGRLLLTPVIPPPAQ
ncbi:hypothetical protein HCN51_31165 [Nonomuraea sp. FMUSA5-5]|uniref:Uncharacterized protein n=1 Tax=Nonomuraea composti TaxID=2720023 RepID=A0ABX1BBT8_9ACTN|nr:DUF5995 family protein [Nonomuraea sp. FMUSA5-5]NJP93852.1 hypothetical protein [Nonomuraea sp. FMUSA5-5]